MKKILVAFMFGVMAIAAHAEATFEQVQTLIEQHNYSAAEKGLEVIIQNHPKSAKAFYAMAQAQAGLGNLEKAQKALDIATGLNPTLDFAPASAVASLKQAITPQVKKIEAVEESHFWRNFAYFALFAGFGVACYFLYSVYARKQEEEAAEKATKEAQWAKEMDEAQARHDAVKAQRESEKAKTNDVSSYDSSYTPRPAYKGPTQTVAPAPAPTTTVINNTTSNSSSDLLTGVILGNMMSSHHDHHDTTIIREREVVRESAPTKSSSWDDTPSTPSRSSSWDDDSSSKSSSSWSSSSSDSSSSWDSGSSSSDSGSSSWD